MNIVTYSFPHEHIKFSRLSIYYQFNILNTDVKTSQILVNLTTIIPTCKGPLILSDQK